MARVALGLVDHSGTIAAGGVAQFVFSNTNKGRQYLLLQNIDAVDLWVRITADNVAAAANAVGSIRLAPGSTLIFEHDFIPTGKVSVVGSATGQKFTCWEA